MTVGVGAEVGAGAAPGLFSCADALEMAVAGAGEVEAMKVIGISTGAGFGKSLARRAGAETYKPKLSTIKPHAMRNSLLMFIGAL